MAGDKVYFGKEDAIVHRSDPIRKLVCSHFCLIKSINIQKHILLTVLLIFPLIIITRICLSQCQNFDT